MTRLLLISLIGFLGACAETTANDTRSFRDCDAEFYNRYLWQKVSVLESVDLPQNTRVILPDHVVTMDHVAGRLNFQIGELGRVERVYCG